MDDGIGLTPEERALLQEALTGPVGSASDDPDPSGQLSRNRLQCCVNLTARGLLQRAAARPGLRGWRPPTFAYLLTCEGWSLLKDERRGGGRLGPPQRRTN